MNALVMYDHQTNTLWSHFTGDAVQGSLVGTKLEILPAMQTLWGQWKELHPGTLVLDKEGSYEFGAYQGYYEIASAGVIGETRRDDRLHRKMTVLGVLINGLAKAYSRVDLYNQPVINDSVAGKDLVVTYDSEIITAGVFNRDVAGRTLTFRPIESKESDTTLMVDDETGSRWLLLTGEAIEDDLKGTVLEQIPYNYSFWFAWKDRYPSTQLFLRDDLPS